MLSLLSGLRNEQRRKRNQPDHHDTGNNHRQAAHGALQFARFQ